MTTAKSTNPSQIARSARFALADEVKAACLAAFPGAQGKKLAQKANRLLEPILAKPSPDADRVRADVIRALRAFHEEGERVVVRFERAITSPATFYTEKAFRAAAAGLSREELIARFGEPSRTYLHEGEPWLFFWNGGLRREIPSEFGVALGPDGREHRIWVSMT